MSIVLALMLDAVFGEPRILWDRIPHPAVIMGRAVGWIDTQFNHGMHRRRNGILSFAALVVCAGALGLVLAALPGIWAEVICGAVLLAQKSLVQHVQAVAIGLRQSLTGGRQAVAMIVSRDTAQMDSSSVARSAIESAAENMSDGVIAPVFWFAIGGLPGLFIYKITNTADSMIGYRTPKHEAFGWAAARFDDLLNIVPARATALLFWLVRRGQGAWTDIIADAGRHKSPNAGWPEAALARSLGIALAGPRSYDGAVRDFPFVNPAGARDLGPDDIDRAIRALWQVWAVALGLAICAAGARLVLG